MTIENKNVNCEAVRDFETNSAHSGVHDELLKQLQVLCSLVTDHAWLRARQLTLLRLR